MSEPRTVKWIFKSIGEADIGTAHDLWLAKTSSLARSLRISNIQIAVHRWRFIYEDSHETLLNGPGGTLAGPDGVFGRHRQ
jgi:hypothetical protein